MQPRQSHIITARNSKQHIHLREYDMRSFTSGKRLSLNNHKTCQVHGIMTSTEFLTNQSIVKNHCTIERFNIGEDPLQPCESMQSVLALSILPLCCKTRNLTISTKRMTRSALVVILIRQKAIDMEQDVPVRYFAPSQHQHCSVVATNEPTNNNFKNKTYQLPRRSNHKLGSSLINNSKQQLNARTIEEQRWGCTRNAAPYPVPINVDGSVCRKWVQRHQWTPPSKHSSHSQRLPWWN